MGAGVPVVEAAEDRSRLMVPGGGGSRPLWSASHILRLAMATGAVGYIGVLGQTAFLATRSIEWYHWYAWSSIARCCLAVAKVGGAGDRTASVYE